jgi:dTDP-4-amino-4,6-dideoxy-D-galactose acyltransferase
MKNISSGNYRILEWDSDFFGFGVGRILPSRLTSDELKATLESMRNENVTLVYWPSDPEDPGSQEAARRHGGFLADRKITYVVDLERISDQLAEEKNKAIREYTDSGTNDELDALAIQSGIYSRYKVDPNIGNALYEKLYKLWILGSVNGTLAEKVFVFMDEEKIAGMVTVGMKNGRGEIGLIAVHESMRGRSVGVHLTRAAQKWAIAKGRRHAQVVTQGNNPAACRLYEKCGYHVESTVNYYHIWL